MNKLLKKFNCVFCKYKKYNKNFDYACLYKKKEFEECYSLSNIYYGKTIKCFPFKQIHYIKNRISEAKENRYCKKMNQKYGDYTIETDDIKFIWGVTNWDELSGMEANLFTMNDIDITFNKKERTYMLGIETAYCFDSYEAECNYLQQCLSAFTKYMEDNHLKKEVPFILTFNTPRTSMTARTIEELYKNFKIFVDGFCAQKTKL